LGCTALGIILDDQAGIPAFDTTKLLAHALLDESE